MTTFTGIVYYKDGKEVKKMSEEEFNKIKDSTEFVDELKDKVHEQYDEIQELKRELQDTKEHLGEYLHEQEEENKRLNNIIKTLEEYVIGEQISEYGDTLDEAKEYLEKLKGSDKE
jgi:uncharacterized coiled-coil DUF342 family protein